MKMELTSWTVDLRFFVRRMDCVFVQPVLSGKNVSRSIALATFEDRRSPPSSVFASSPPLAAVPLRVVTNPTEIGARNGVAATRAGVKNTCVFGWTMVGSECALE